MLPKKYHALIFIGILVMLLLLGLHLLGIGYSSSQATAKPASSVALARNSSSSAAAALASQTASSSSQQQQVYRHPIAYDKLTGSTNNQIHDVLGGSANNAATKLADYPIDHYQQQQQQQQSNPHQLNQLPQQQQQPPDDFFNTIHQPPPGFPRHMIGPVMPVPPPLAPPPPSPSRHRLMTTLPPTIEQRMHHMQMPVQPTTASGGTTSSAANNELERETAAAAPATANPQVGVAPLSDSLHSESSLNNNNNNNSNMGNNNRQINNATSSGQQQQPPIYYTPPIFAYNQFDQNNRVMNSELPPGLPPYGGFPPQPAQPPLGIPEPPLSIDEYNARQARLRQQQLSPQQQQQQMNEISQLDRYGKPMMLRQNQLEPQFLNQQQQQQQNLLADPQQQQRHKQQMLDRALLFNGQNFGNQNYPPPPVTPEMLNQTTQRLVQPPPLSQQPPGVMMRAPYAQTAQAELEQALAMKQQAQQNQRNLQPQQPQKQQQQQQPPNSKLALATPIFSGENRMVAAAPPTINSPNCARQMEQQQTLGLEQVNNVSAAALNNVVAFCQEDNEYPTKEIMRALENYAGERSIEQLLPQSLIQIRQTDNNIQHQLTLDSLQPSILGFQQQPVANDKQLLLANNKQLQLQQQQQQLNSLFPSANFEDMCRSSVFLVQPRRAKNLFGQWKVVVNLPGHKYRGIAVSQSVRVEQCARPMAECGAPPAAAPNIIQTTPASRGLNTQTTTANNNNNLLLARSRCLQHYENQRLLAWSHQQGLHMDIFRFPVACSCHIRR